MKRHSYKDEETKADLIITKHQKPIIFVKGWWKSNLSNIILFLIIILIIFTILNFNQILKLPSEQVQMFSTLALVVITLIYVVLIYKTLIETRKIGEASIAPLLEIEMNDTKEKISPLYEPVEIAEKREELQKIYSNKKKVKSRYLNVKIKNIGVGNAYNVRLEYLFIIKSKDKIIYKNNHILQISQRIKPDETIKKHICETTYFPKYYIGIKKIKYNNIAGKQIINPITTSYEISNKDF